MRKLLSQPYSLCPVIENTVAGTYRAFRFDEKEENDADTGIVHVQLAHICPTINTIFNQQLIQCTIIHLNIFNVYSSQGYRNQTRKLLSLNNVDLSGVANK
jgi:hypothetical protein